MIKMIPKNTVFLLLFTVTLLAACSKKEGPIGPAGTQGVPGPQGPAGSQGQTGTANVIVYTFGSKTFTGNYGFLLNNLSKGKMDSSMVLGYYNGGSDAAPNWYPMPGLGPIGSFESRCSTLFSGVNQFTFSVRLQKPDGLNEMYPSAVTFRQTKIFIIPAATIIPEGKRSQPDLNNYYEVTKYYGIEE